MKLILQVLKGWIFSPHKLGSGLNDKNIYTYLEAKNIALEFLSIKYLITEFQKVLLVECFMKGSQPLLYQRLF